MTTRVLAAACFLACLLLAPATSSAASYDEADSALRQHLVDAYEELGQWCVKKQLFLARDELAEVIIQLRPDHKRARGWLKYRKGRDGTWSRKEPHKAPKNRKLDGLPEFEQRRDAILADLRPKVVVAIRDAKPALSSAARLEAVQDWRSILGDDPDLMALGGLMRHDGRWRATDTVRSIKRRAAIEAAAKKALANRPKTETRTLPEAAKAIELPWQVGRGTKRVAAFGTVSPDLLDSCVGMVHATEALMAEQFGDTFEVRDYFAFYLLGSRDHFRMIVDKHPGVSGNRKLLRDLTGAYVGHGQYAKFMETQGGALDTLISVTTKHLLALRYAEGRSVWMPGWVADGFALYNMTHLTGHHLSFTVDFGRYGQDPLFKSLFKSSTNWLAKARELMLSDDPAILRLALGLKIGHLKPHDFLASYAFVTWLHEARSPQEVDALLRALAEGKDVDKAFAGSLKMSVEDAETHLKRWLKETGG